MATYYHGNPEIQADGLQTLVLTNPGYVGFSDPQSAAAHFAFHNPSSAGAANSYSHQPPHFVGHPQDISLHHGFPPRQQYVSWNPMEVAAAPGGEREGPRPQQGLSLSLSPQQPARYGAYCGEQEGVSQALAASGLPSQVGESLRMPGGSSVAASRITNAVSGMQSVLLSSRFLKAAQLLLEEFVNVGNGMKNESAGKRPHGKMVGESSASAADGDGDKRCPEQSTAGRQEVLMKKAKLVSMLDEVEQRYRQYQQQMQMVIAGFEQMAGIGSAKTYTALALKTISKQFRSLNDAIDGQIAAANRSLGEDVLSTTGGKGEGSRLRFVDHQLRQQRALQQLGMIQHNNAWRPQRGLPERAVSVLRAWLFEHFLHPYPKDSDKHTLAKQTGLTRNQVSNWFINARVRLWKPMVEEMYTEEIKEHEQNQQSDKTSTSDGFAEKCPIPDNRDGNSTAASVSLAGVTSVTVMASQGSPKRPRTTESRLFASDSPDVNIKPEGGNPNDVVWMKFGVDGQSPRQDTDEYSANFIGGFGSYPIGEIGRFDAQPFPASFAGSGNANVNGNVSLTLGLPHCENLPLSGSDRRNYLPNHGIQMVGPAEYSGLSTAAAAAATVSGFEDLNIQSQKRFAAQLLPDFVA